MKGTVIEAARHQWRQIIIDLGKVDPALLDGKHHACPSCGGTDRFRFEDKDGTGNAFCSQCGGRKKTGGGMSGSALLMRVTGWNFHEAMERVERHLGLGASTSNGRSRVAQVSRPPTIKPPNQAAAPPPPPGPDEPLNLLSLPKPAEDLVPMAGDGRLAVLWIRNEEVETAVQATYAYSTNQQVIRHFPVSGTTKEFLPQCRSAARWINGRGNAPWPAWRQGEAKALATQHPGHWLLEAEGEKAAEIVRAGGLACISQPGHAHKSEQMRPRYAALKAAGVAGVVFLADNDAVGIKRAQAAQEAASAEGLALVILPAAEVWSGLPKGGSIDDAPEAPVERVAALAKRVAQITGKQWSEIVDDWQQLAEEAEEGSEGESPDAPPSSRPTKQQLQQFLLSRHVFEHDELKSVPVIDGAPVEPQTIRHYDQRLAELHGIEVPERVAEGCLRYLCRKAPFNPVERYLRKVATSTDARLLQLREIGAAFGMASDDTASLDALKRHLIGAVKRGLQPGYKHDSILILQGPQGFLKSEVIAALCPEPPWADSLSTVPDFEGWPFLIRLSACWHLSLDECDRLLRGKHSSELKGFITRRSDDWARKGENEKTSHSRRCVLWGTTNETHGLLNDPTGVRRFWLATVIRMCDLNWIAANRDSIWATALAWAAAGELSYYPPGDFLGRIHEGRAWASSCESPYTGPIFDLLNSLDADGEGVTQEYLTLTALGIDLSELFPRRRECMDVIEQIVRCVTAANFRTHGGRVAWKKIKRRFDGRPNPVVGFRPVICDEPAESQPAAANGVPLPGEPEIPRPRCASASEKPPVPKCSEVFRRGRNGQTLSVAADPNPCSDRSDVEEVHTQAHAHTRTHTHTHAYAQVGAP